MKYIFLDAVGLLFWTFEILIIIRVFMTWVPINPYNKFICLITDITDPFLSLIESYLPRQIVSPINFSPIIAIFLIKFAESIVLRILTFIVLQ